MKFSLRTHIILFSLLIILNILLRVQVVPQEIGVDSFEMHCMVNSLTEFGQAKWILSPLSIVGLYPGSYASAMHFLISSFQQLTGLNMNMIIYGYCLALGILSIFTSYYMASEIFEDDIPRFITAFGFSLSPAVLDYSTWTIPARGLFTVLAPLFVAILLKEREKFSKTFALLLVLFGLFLFTAHHLFYFLIPPTIGFLIIKAIHHLNEKGFRFNSRYLEPMTTLLIIFGFVFMFAIPFFTGKFIEMSRYSPIYIDYSRYMGILLIPAIGGLFYTIFKEKKSFGEWYILLSLMFLTVFIYEQTYMKGFMPIFLILFAAIGISNILKNTEKQKLFLIIGVLFLVSSVAFCSYFQFLKDYRESPYNQRYIEDSVYKTGLWMGQYDANSSVSNDMYLGTRVFSSSETAKVLTSSTTINNIYGFLKLDPSQYERYPLTSEDFWFTGYQGKDFGEIQWEHIVTMREKDPQIKYFIENTKSNGFMIWNHKSEKSNLLEEARNENLIYDTGNINIWTI